MFKKIIPFAAILFTSSLVTSCVDIDIEGPCRRASGPLETVGLTLPDFDAIHFQGSGEMFIEYGTTQRVVVTAEENIIENLDFRVENGRLVTDFDGCYRNYDLTIEVTLARPMKELKISGSGRAFTRNLPLPVEPRFDVEISGSGDADLEIADAEKVYGQISGSGAITLIGEADFLETRISGSGDMKAYDFKAFENKVSISGSGKAYIYCNNGPLDVVITGSGEVYYKGTASSVNTRITGSGRVYAE